LHGKKSHAWDAIAVEMNRFIRANVPHFEDAAIPPKTFRVRHHARFLFLVSRLP
jgi:hypothetical protein